MDPSNDLKPRISVTVPAMLGYDFYSRGTRLVGGANLSRAAREFSSFAQLRRIIQYRRAMLWWKPDRCCFTRRGPPECEEPKRTS